MNWQQILDWACRVWTGGAHDFKTLSATAKKCRICGARIVVVPPVVVPPIPDPPVPDDGPPADPSAEPNPARPSAYAAGFLWKPKSESTGQLVVLAPERFTGHIESTWLEFNGLSEKPYGGQVANGNRYHSRFAKAGGAYPSPALFRLRTDAGRVWSWSVSRTGSRNGDSGEITPTVTP